MKKATTLILIIFTSMFAIQLWGQNMEKEIKKYSGDGEIRDISFNHMWFFKVKGYDIRFAKFDLTKDYENIFILENLPSCSSSTIIHLAITDNKNWTDKERSKTTNYLEINLIDDKKEIILKAKQKINKYRWTTYAPVIKGYKYTYGIYDIENTIFNAVKNKTYKLHVKYQGNDNFKNAVGYFFIRCGGSL